MQKEDGNVSDNSQDSLDEAFKKEQKVEKIEPKAELVKKEEDLGRNVEPDLPEVLSPNSIINDDGSDD